MARLYGRHPAGTAILIIADLAALILFLWIFFFLVDANRDNGTVAFIRDAADWLAAWSRDLFTVDSANWRTILNYGLPAVIYLVIGHLVGGRIGRTSRA